MKDMIAELKQRYDFIFFDSPPILGVSDASVLASEVDMVVAGHSIPPLPAADEHSRQTDDRKGRRQPCRHRAQQHQHVAGRKLLLLHRLLPRLLSTSRRKNNRCPRGTTTRPMTPTRAGSNKSIDCCGWFFTRMRGMKLYCTWLVRGLSVCGLLFAGLLLAGCCFVVGRNPLFRHAQ